MVHPVNAVSAVTNSHLQFCRSLCLLSSNIDLIHSGLYGSCECPDLSIERVRASPVCHSSNCMALFMQVVLPICVPFSLDTSVPIQRATLLYHMCYHTYFNVCPLDELSLWRHVRHHLHTLKVHKAVQIAQSVCRVYHDESKPG